MSTYTERMEEKKERLSRELKAIYSNAMLDGRKGLRPEEAEKFKQLEAELRATEHTILAANRVDSMERQMRDADPRLANTMLGREELTEEQVEADKRAHQKIFQKYLRFGAHALDEQDKRVLQRMMPDDGTAIRNAQTITSTGGGYLVPQGFSDKLEVALKWASGIVRACGEITTATGNPLPFPTMNDTANSGVLVAVNTQLSEQDVTLGQVVFESSIFSSGTVLLPQALAQDSFFSMDDWLAKALGVRLGRVMNSYLTTGTGSSQPNGIVTAVVAAGNIVTGATGDATTVKYNDLSNLIESVDEAYLEMPTCGWMMSQSTRKAIRELVDSSNRPLWTEGLISNDGAESQAKLLGFPVWINNAMPAMAANAYPILFGDMSQYVVRRTAGGTTVRRLVERYADYLQVGYLAYTRADGQLLDAGTHPIAAFQNSAT